MEDDLDRVRHALLPIAERSRTLAWARERPWAPQTHVWMEHGAPCVDLHDLSVKLAVEAVERSALLAPSVRAGSVLYITGRGRHNADGSSPLADAVRETLATLESEHGWRYRVQARGRLVLLAEPDRAPEALSGALGWGFWIGAAVFVALASLASVWLGAILGVSLLALYLTSRMDQR